MKARISTAFTKWDINKINLSFRSYFDIFLYMPTATLETLNLHPLEREPIVLFSDDVSDYTADVLYLILPRIMNPYGINRDYDGA